MAVRTVNVLGMFTSSVRHNGQGSCVDTRGRLCPQRRAGGGTTQVEGGYGTSPVREVFRTGAGMDAFK